MGCPLKIPCFARPNAINLHLGIVQTIHFCKILSDSGWLIIALTQSCAKFPRIFAGSIPRAPAEAAWLPVMIQYDLPIYVISVDLGNQHHFCSIMFPLSYTESAILFMVDPKKMPQLSEMRSGTLELGRFHGSPFNHRGMSENTKIKRGKSPNSMEIEVGRSSSANGGCSQDMLTPERFTLQKISPLCSKTPRCSSISPFFQSVESPLAEDLLLFRLLKGLGQLLLIQLFRFLVEQMAEIRRRKTMENQPFLVGRNVKSVKSLGRSWANHTGFDGLVFLEHSTKLQPWI